MKKPNLKNFEKSLPYSSQLFGVYQPLIGWRSKRTKKKIDSIERSMNRSLMDKISLNLRLPHKIVTFNQQGGTTDVVQFPFPVESLEPSVKAHPQIESVVSIQIAEYLNNNHHSVPPLFPEWQFILRKESIETYLEMARGHLSVYLNKNGTISSQEVKLYLDKFFDYHLHLERVEIGELFAKREIAIASFLQGLLLNNPKSLNQLYYSEAPGISSSLSFGDPLKNFGQHNLDAILSPIGVIHLFRQYFFEFDAVAGPPIGHVWVSPGATVELIEINTRRKVTELNTEKAIELIHKTESNLVIKDEISDAIKQENNSNTQFGFSADATYSVPTFEASASASINLDNSRRDSRETTHKFMREQSTKVSGEIKSEYKSTFKISTETQDTTSKRYVISNRTKDLQNYELKRKMRQVGIQVQDISVQLCWHTFVDDCGRDLGVSKLIHIAKPADLAMIRPPEAPVLPEVKAVQSQILFPYQNISGSDEMDVVFYDGDDRESGWFDHNDRIVWKRTFTIQSPAPGYTMGRRIDLVSQHSSVCAADVIWIDQNGSLEIRLRQVNFDNQPNINFRVTTYWDPPAALVSAIQQVYTDKVKEYTNEKERIVRTAYTEAARERVKLASEIKLRPSEDLREEERIIVYRQLLSQLMKVPGGSDVHVTSELIKQIFDVDKMLYFVAPEWWQPRLHQSHQNVDPSNQPITDENIVGWGGIKENRPDNYYITEDSAPARFGSSLGWLLQLDGDDLRNAFLNSPWVKAVIPIRQGKEEEAINWLSLTHVEGSDGLGAMYRAPEAELTKIRQTLNMQANETVTIKNALQYLGNKIEKQNKGSNGVASELVYENGFQPLSGTVKLDESPQKVFSQWVEIVPTDQVIAEKYEPK